MALEIGTGFVFFWGGEGYIKSVTTHSTVCLVKILGLYYNQESTFYSGTRYLMKRNP